MLKSRKAEKAFAEISWTVLTEALTGKNAEHATPLSYKSFKKSDTDRLQIYSNKKILQTIVQSFLD